MTAAHYPYIDICALEPVRGRFAAGEAVAVLSQSLDRVIWANGAGAALFGFADVAAVIGAEPQMGSAARRQIMATSGYPRIGRDRAITVRLASGLTSRAVSFAASEIALPDGAGAILLAAPPPAASWRNPIDTATRSIAGLDQAGQHAAIIDAEGRPVAASPEFGTLGIKPETLAALVAEARGDRLVKRLIEAEARTLPAGFLRLADHPATHLLVVVDEASVEADAAPVDEAADATDIAVVEEAPGAASDGIERSTAEPAAAEGSMPASDATGTVETADPASDDDEPAPSPEEPVATLASADAETVSADPLEDNAFPADDGEAPVAAEEPETAAAAETSGGGEQSGQAEVPAGSETAETPAAESSPSGAEDGIDAAAPLAGTPVRVEIDRTAAPVRFVWKTDAAGRFSEISADFAATVGDSAAAVIGLSFREAAARLRIDPSGEIAGLLERHDTWSGRSVLWPVAGTDLRIPVDLAALPTYDRDRKFAGFRGFGIARAADAVVDPDATGIALLDGQVSTPAAAEAGPNDAASDRPASTDPFQGEVPILTIVPRQDRRSSDKVIRLAEHRQPTIDKALSPGERSAFREIGDRLRKDSGASAPTPPAEPALRADNDPQRPADRPAGTAAGDGGQDAESEDPRPGGAGSEVEQTAEQAEASASPASPGADATEHPEEPAAAEHEGAVEELGVEGDGPIADEAPAEEVVAGAAAMDSEHVETGAADAALGPADELPEESAEAAAEVPAAARGEDLPKAADRASATEPAARPDYLPSAFAVGDPSSRRVPVDTSILEKLPVPVLIHAGDALHYANREFLDFTGYETVEEIEAAGGLGVLFGDPYPAEDGEDDEPGRKLRLRTSEGLEYPVEAFLQSVPWGEGKALLLSLRRSWRQAVSYPAAPSAATAPAAPDLEARIAEMRAIVDTATDGVVLIAPDGAIRSISSPAEALFGFDSAEVAGKPFTSLFAIESQRAARDYLNGLSDHGVASVLNDGREVIGREAQGRFIPLFMTIGKLPNDSGYCAVVRDITQWKRAEEELTQARAQAERASSQKTDFLARVSHEIRTPLNAIIGFSELMLDEKFGPVGNDRYRDYLRDINRSGNHVLDLVNDLLDISKIEAGQQEMSYEAVSLNDTLAETVAMMQPAANRERVIIRSSFASRLPEVVADLRSIRQIALNLLSNAVRYTPAGGQVIVSTAYEASGDVVMRVRDTGIGMSQSEIEQALKPFKQINALKRARGDGTGLGLPLTKAMVEANRARFIINSTPGEGTLVEVSFPSTRVLAD